MAANAEPGGAAPAPDGTAAELEEDADGSVREPRELYNSGVASLEAGELEPAEEQLRRSRSLGAQDPELRFRSTYNLGLATARRAEAAREAEPETALALYYEAADRFRDAVRQRPEEADVRHNLEVVLRRALVLADQLAQQKQGGIEAQLGALIERQRTVQGRLAALLEQRPDDPGYDADPAVRREYRSIAADQRVLLSDADALARQVAAERDALEADDGDPDPSRAERRARLGPLIEHLDLARERMGRARGQMRLQQGARAYRRTASALSELKRALDALRDPVSVLDGIAQDASETVAWIAAWNRGRVREEGATTEPPLPSWLTTGFIGEQQEQLVERTSELAAVLTESAKAPDADPVGTAEAVPLLEQGAGSFREAQAAVQEYAGERALEAQVRGVQLLLDARERFLELRGLVELTYRDARRIEQGLRGGNGESKSERAATAPVNPAAQRALAGKNVQRAERVARLVERERAALEIQPQAAEQPDPNAEAAKQRLERAKPLVARAATQLRGVDAELQREPAREDSARAAVREAIGTLAELRRLFFSVQELLRETAERQLELNDDTRDVGALSDPRERAPRVDALLSRQRELARLGTEIAQTLDEQAESADVAAPPAEADPAAQAEAMGEAAELVRTAETAMQRAIDSLAASEPSFAEAAPSQTEAAEKLAEALAKLVPPESRPPQKQEPEQQDGSQQDASRGGRQGASPQPEPVRDPGQILQSVRDREAQRRRERAERSDSGYETVERDW